ncbi:MAG: hypothetical protein V1901_03865 [Patescibacteria group bacterium]
MKYEQKKYKIAELWEESQNNTNELNKKKNDSLVSSPNNFFKKSKSLLNPSWIIIVPEYLAKPKINMITYPENGRTYYCKNLTKIIFYGTFYLIHVQIFKSGGLIFDQMVVPVFDEELEEYHYLFTGYELSLIQQYNSIYTIRSRPYTGSKFYNWSDLTTFYTYPYYPVPLIPGTVYAYLYKKDLKVGKQKYSYDPEMGKWTSNLYYFYQTFEQDEQLPEFTSFGQCYLPALPPKLQIKVTGSAYGQPGWVNFRDVTGNLIKEVTIPSVPFTSEIFEIENYNFFNIYVTIGAEFLPFITSIEIKLTNPGSGEVNENIYFYVD